LLVRDARLEVGDVAMRWFGMPNKNERALTSEILDALTNAGYLESDGEGVWTVRKTIDD
jgi:hypothetical protein